VLTGSEADYLMLNSYSIGVQVPALRSCTSINWNVTAAMAQLSTPRENLRIGCPHQRLIFVRRSAASDNN